MPPSTTSLLGCLSLLTALTAQTTEQPAPTSEPAMPRATVAGRVVTADGSPWAGATVVLSAHTTPNALELGRFDRVETTTGERGIFRTSVLRGLAYSVIAHQAAEDGLTRRTELRHGVVPGTLVTLREGRPQPATRIQVRIPDGWSDLAPFSLRVLFPHPNLPPLEVPLDAEHNATTPPLPDGTQGVEVLDRNGEALCHRQFSMSSRRGRAVGTVISVPEPVEVPVRVYDADDEPIAGAEIRFRIHRGVYFTAAHDLLTDSERQTWRLCGVTDAEGRAVVRAPLKFDPFGPLPQRRWKEAVFAASTPGWMQAHSGHYQESVFWNGARQTAEVDELQFLLRESRPRTGRILIDPKTPLVGARVLVTAVCKMNAHQNGWTHLDRRFVAETDAEGRWQVPDFPHDGNYVEVNCLLPDALRAELAVDDLLPGWTTMFDLPQGGEEPVVDLSQMRPLRIEVQGAEAGPAVGSQVKVFPLDTGVNLERNVPWVRRVDRRGQVLLHLQPGAYGVLVARDDGWSRQQIEIPARGDALPQLSMQLEPWPTMRLRVLGPDGTPPASVSSYLSGISMMSSNDGSFEDRLREEAHSLMSHFANQPTWQDGILTIRCLAFPGMRMELRISAPGCGDRDVVLEPTEGAPLDVVLQRS